MSQFMNMLDGKKTYLALLLGAIVIVANHFGIHAPGTTLDPNNWLNDLFTLALVATGRSAITKVGG